VLHLKLFGRLLLLLLAGVFLLLLHVVIVIIVVVVVVVVANNNLFLAQKIVIQIPQLHSMQITQVSYLQCRLSHRYNSTHSMYLRTIFALLLTVTCFSLLFSISIFVLFTSYILAEFDLTTHSSLGGGRRRYH
jgi:hypothetical protein